MPDLPLICRAESEAAAVIRTGLDAVDRFQLHQPSGLPVLQMELEQRTRGEAESDLWGWVGLSDGLIGAIKKNTVNAASDS